MVAAESDDSCQPGGLVQPGTDGNHPGDRDHVERGDQPEAAGGPFRQSHGNALGRWPEHDYHHQAASGYHRQGWPCRGGAGAMTPKMIGSKTLTTALMPTADVAPLTAASSTATARVT